MEPTRAEPDGRIAKIMGNVITVVDPCTLRFRAEASVVGFLRLP